MSSGGPGPSAGAGPLAASMAMFDRRVETVKDARLWVESFLRENEVDRSVVDDAVLVVSELVTNALRHGEGAAVVRASVRNEVLELSVTDTGDSLPAQQPIDLGRVGGLGLQVVERVSAEWGVAPFPGGKTVWAVIHLRGR